MVELYTLDRFVDGIETLLLKALKDLKAESGSLMVLDRKENVLKIKVAASLSSDPLSKGIVKNTKVKLGQSVSGMVAQTGKPIIINDVSQLKKDFPDLRIETDSARYNSSLIVPIREEALTVAVLNINNRTDGGKFTRKDLKLAEMLAEYCGVALKLERQNRGVLLVNEIIREINQTNSLEDIYRLVIAKGAGILDCREASLMIVEKDADGSHCLVVKESTDRKIVGERRKLGESVSGYVWKTGEPVLIKSVKDGTSDRRFKILNKPGSFIVVPLNLKYQTPYALNVALKSVSTIGVLNFTQRHDKKPFTTEQLEALINYSNLVAIAIEKARYYNDSKIAYLSTVKVLSAVLESKDPYTKGHSDGVESLCGMMAEKLGLSNKDKEDLEIAALLHDIGKIGIPESILNKQGKLTKGEYEKIKTHIEEADNILKHTFYLEESRQVISCHHEHYDGSGYPAGLKGEEIPLGARILSAADAFHAMSSDRPYRKALPMDVVKKEFAKGRGNQFDPDVVDILLDLVNAVFPDEEIKGANA
jgi:HD-GYP domain-containing protein (c-di-GMP phosphodiesterase class II)